jgi:HEAT repeat protein
VKALASWGFKEVAPFARDPSHLVRLAVAAELAKRPTVDSALLLSEMAVDSNVDVQLAAIRAVRGWPDRLARPLLLQSMRDSSARTRLEASRQIADGDRETGIYRFDGPPEERAAAVTAMAARLGSSPHYLEQVLQREPRADAQVDAIRAAEVRAHLAALIENPEDSPAAAAALDWLKGLAPRDLPIVEAFVQQPTKAPADRIHRDVLPKLGPCYAALADLKSDDVNARRRGAQILAERGQRATLNRPVLAQLRERLLREPDELVWRFALEAIASDATDECADLANVALHHSLPAIRQLGCEHLGRHGQPSYATWLLELLDDPNRGVQLAAVRALGNCGNQIAVRGLPAKDSRHAASNLRSVMAGSDPALRFAAAVSLCRLGATEGVQELVRLSYHSSFNVREDAVREMGLSGQTRFVDHLITLGWTESNEQVRRMILQSLDRLVPVENRPSGLAETPAVDAKIRRWAQWWQERSGGQPHEMTPGAPLASRPAKQT